MPFSIPQPPKQIEPALVSPRGAHLATRLWMPSCRHVKAVCLLVSGECLHSGYFEGLAGRLNREGIAVAAYDLVCTGYSDSEPCCAQSGCFHIESIDCWVEDIFAAAVWAKERAKASNYTPFFLLGESLGGMQVLAAALDSKNAQAQHDVKFSGVIALSALIEPAPGLLPSRAIIKMLSLFSPCFPQLKLPAPEVTPNFDDAFGNSEWALTARADPMVRIVPKPTLAAALSMIKGAERIESRAKTLDLPLLAIHAVKDNRAVFAAVQQVVDRVGSKAEGLWIENTTGHQLLQDRREVTERVKEKIANWIVLQLQSGGEI